MNVLVVYDIHGNVDALEAVLADPRATGTDAVVVGGDTVPGPFARAALERLDELDAPVHWIRGNGERETAVAASSRTRPPTDDLAAVTAALTAAALAPERARSLGDLPLTLTLDGVLYCHATPRAAAAGVRMLAAGRPDEELVRGALIEPVEPMGVTSLFEDLAGG